MKNDPGGEEKRNPRCERRSPHLILVELCLRQASCLWAQQRAGRVIEVVLEFDFGDLAGLPGTSEQRPSSPLRGGPP